MKGFHGKLNVPEILCGDEILISIDINSERWGFLSWRWMKLVDGRELVELTFGWKSTGGVSFWMEENW
jgi:hypothetical protein